MNDKTPGRIVRPQGFAVNVFTVLGSTRIIACREVYFIPCSYSGESNYVYQPCRLRRRRA